MAIVIQEEQKERGGWFGFGIVLLILLCIGIAAYYLFFVDPNLINSAFVPVQLESLDELSKLDFSIDDIASGGIFGEKRQFVPLPSLPTSRNIQPFGIQ